MESLRRLTSSVFDGSAGVRRRHSVSDLSTDARSLELTFVTDRLLVSGFPVDRPTDKKLNHVNVDELAQYLDAHHRNQYLMFNLNALEDVVPTVEPTRPLSPVSVMGAAQRVETIAAKLHEQLLEFGWERDGMKAHTPPLDLVFRICYAIFAWLSLDARHVAIINCQTGKTRSGVVVACYLLYARLAEDPIEAFVEFYRKRWDMKALTPQALRNKTPPSIQRFLTSFYDLVEQQKAVNDKPLLLKAIIFRQLPVEMQPCVQIWDDYRMVFCTDGIPVSEADAPVLDWNEEDGFFALLWENGVELDGGFSILCSFGEDYGGAEEVDASSRVLFRYADSTWFLNPGLLTLKKNQLDLMKQYEHGFDDEHFSMDLVLHDNNSMKRRQTVRVDYTGNNAVRQGLIEITKHHMVLPDPAMHSNFIRMGFSETPTTFSLQRSQNTPNVALDYLHLDGLSAFFRQDNPDPVPEGKESVAKKSDLPETTAVDSPSPAIQRQTTADIVAMQSVRRRYSTPTVTESSLCAVCREDDYMMRPQVVQCTGACKKHYHTTCVGLRKVPFGLTTLSDRTNHSVYVKKFFSSWQCDSCVNAEQGVHVGAIPADMTLVPTSWVKDRIANSVSSSDDDSANNSANPQDVSGAAATLATVSSQLFQVDNNATSTKVVPPDLTSRNQDDDNLDKLRALLVSSGMSIDDLLKAATTQSSAPSPAPPERNVANVVAGGTTDDASEDGIATGSRSFLSGTATTGDLPTAMKIVNELIKPESDAHSGLRLNAVPASLSATAQKAVSTVKYQLMLKRGVPFEAVRNCMVRDGVDPTALLPLAPPVVVPDTSSEGTQSSEEKAQITRLKDVAEYRPYFNMLRMGCPREAVKQKLVIDGLDPNIIDLGPEANFEDVKHRITEAQSCSKLQDNIKLAKPNRVDTMAIIEGVDKPAASETRVASVPDSPQDVAASGDVKLKEHEVYAKYFKMLKMGLPEDAVRHKMRADGANERALELGGDALFALLVVPVKDKGVVAPTLESNEIKLKDHEVYGKYFKMLNMGLPDGAVRQKMKTDGTDERALDLGGEALFSLLIVHPASKSDVKLKDHEVYGKYFKMLQMGLPEGAVQQKVQKDGADIRALSLGPEALASALEAPATAAATASTKPKATKPPRGRKKLHWQPISEDRLSSINQQTIWEDKEEDIVEFEMDMDELESLFFANRDGAAKKAAGRGGKVLKRRQSVTLIDGKRAMNAAISLARVKLSYSAIATAIQQFDPSGLTVQQLSGINEFLPTQDEVAAVNKYVGDVTLLGEVCESDTDTFLVRKLTSGVCGCYRVRRPRNSSWRSRKSSAMLPGRSV